MEQISPETTHLSFMLTSLLLNIVIISHFLFILFVIFGGIVVLRIRWLVWLHIPAVIWAVSLELFGWTCPLTPLEQLLREASNLISYSGGFIEYYLVKIIYPDTLTRELQILFGSLVFLLNLIIYIYFFLTRNRQ